MTFLLYLGKVMLCSGILLGYYWLFLRNRRFHHYNRFYLQATLLLSVILPFIRIPVWNKPQNAVSQAVYQTLEVLTVNYGEADGLDTGPGALARLFTVENMLYLVYGLGITVLLGLLIRSLLYIRKISKQYPFEHIGGLKFFTTREPGTPFSFFRSIFWHKDLPFNSRDGQQIFRHELFHVQQKHSSDIILTEVITAFFWYNPFFHLLKKEMKAIHEFLADQYAVSESDRYAYAELLVLQTLKANHIPISNYFFQNHIKRRIAMITNNQSTRITYRSRLMALPVLAFLFCTIALYAQRSATSSGTRFNVAGSAQKPITVVIDAGHGGTDAGAASTDGKVKEKDLALQISQKIQQLAPSYQVNVVMTRTNDNLPDNTTDKTDGLRARTALTEKTKADLFISIHISAADGNNTDPRNSGFEVFVSNKEDDRTKQSKQLGSAVVQELSKLYNTNPALLQRSMNIWVLERTPCPALLIECGYITNDKDLAFISNGSNQEAIAKKILEGIVKYKDNPAAAANQPEPTQPVAQQAAVVKPAPMATATTAPVAPVVAIPALTTTSAARVIPASHALPASPQQISVDEQTDPIVPKLAAHYCRNVRYPQLALANNTEGIVYFSLAVDNNGNINNFQVYEKAPADAALINKVVTVGYSSTDAPSTGAVSQHATMKMLQEEVKKAFDKKPNLSGYTPQAAQYFFQVTFSLQKRQC